MLLLLMDELLKEESIYGELLKVCLSFCITQACIICSYLLLLFSVENEDHCDFKKLRSLVIRTHMLDLISTSEEVHYENYRQAQMETRKFGYVKYLFHSSLLYSDDFGDIVNLKSRRLRILNSRRKRKHSESDSLSKSRWRKLDSDNGVSCVSSLRLLLPLLTILF